MRLCHQGLAMVSVGLEQSLYAEMLHIPTIFAELRMQVWLTAYDDDDDDDDDGDDEECLGCLSDAW
jgi:hypothetical protein